MTRDLWLDVRAGKCKGNGDDMIKVHSFGSESGVAPILLGLHQNPIVHSDTV